MSISVAAVGTSFLSLQTDLHLSVVQKCEVQARDQDAVSVC